MTGSAILLIRSRPKNYYSFASLVPILKQFEYPLKMVKRISKSDLIGYLNKYDRIFYFDSFMSIDVPKITFRKRIEDKVSIPIIGNFLILKS